MPKIKKTEIIIQEAISSQNNWREHKSRIAKNNLKTAKKSDNSEKSKRSKLRAYWFPIVCILAVIFVAIWTLIPKSTTNTITIAPNAEIPESVKREIPKSDATPMFDIVRIEKDGFVIVAGRGAPAHNISVSVNGKIQTTQKTNARGEFAWAPKNAFKPGNYTLRLVDVKSGKKSENDVFIFISERGFENSLSLLMTENGSKILQAPTLMDGDLTVSQIDYLNTGRLVITGNGLPRLRVSLSLNNRVLGWTRVSDYKHFGMGADVEKLEPGKRYTIKIRLHDGDGNVVSEIRHRFKMPKATGQEDTYYTVRRGDSLWVIARNFLRRGVLFSIISDANKIENPDLIFPKQKLKIPVK